MYEFRGIDFGPTEVTVEAETLRGALDQMGQLYNLHKDAVFLAAHVEFFYDEEAEVVPRARDDDEGFMYRGFECLKTGCNITFKETEEEGGIFPGRYRAYRNGDDNPKLYDPRHSPKEILKKVSPETPYIKHFRVDVGGSQSSQKQGSGHSAGRQQAPPRGEVPDEDDSVRRDPTTSASKQKERRQNGSSEAHYDSQDPPEAQKGTEHGHLDHDSALALWNAAKLAGGYDRQAFSDMLLEEFGVKDGPQYLHVDDFERAWRFACDKEAWEEQRETFEPDDELPF